MPSAQDANRSTQQLQDFFAREIREWSTDIKADLKDIRTSAYSRELATADKQLAAQIHQDIYSKITDTNARITDTNATILRVERDATSTFRQMGDAHKDALERLFTTYISPNEKRLVALENMQNALAAKRSVFHQLGNGSAVVIGLLAGMLSGVGSMLTYFWYLHH